MKEKETNEYYQKIRERIHSLPITNYLNIDQEKELLDLKTRRPDFGLDNNGRYIGIEVTEVRPHKFCNKRNIDLEAIKKELSKLIRERLDANKVNAFRIDVIPQEDIYSIGINTKDNCLIVEINEHLQGNPRSFKYIKKITAEPLVIEDKEYTRPNKEIDIYIEWEGGFAETISSKPVIDAIREKEKKIESYLQENNFKFDELWLFITMPNEEHKFSFKGFALPDGFCSKYDKIYVGQLFPPFANCVFEKS